MALIWVWMVVIIIVPLVLWGYGFVTLLKRWYFEWFGLRKPGALPSLVVGNLTVGGSGKTPMVLFLLESFSKEKVGVLSRGYGRETRGFKIVESSDSVTSVGDEAMEIFSTARDAKVVVCEDRLEGLERMQQEGDLDWVLLDDGYQHLALKSERSVLLTPYERPFWMEKFSLPLGSLREFGSSLKGSDALVITKCPRDWQEADFIDYVSRLSFPIERIFAAHYRISEPQLIHGTGGNPKVAVLVLGIVNTEKKRMVIEGWDIGKQIDYRDHHPFSERDVQYWLKTCRDQQLNSLILTRKDFQRIKNNGLIQILIDAEINLYEIHTEVEILWNKKEQFLALVHP